MFRFKKMSSRSRTPTRIPLEDIAPSRYDMSTSTSAVTIPGVDSSTVTSLLLWFVVVSLVAWFLFYAFKPTVVQKVGVDGRPTGEVDIGKSLLGGLLVGLIVTLVIWLLRSCK